MKKICVVTATRAEYGVLKNTISEIYNHPDLELCLVVMGTHLSKNFGYTVNEIMNDGFPIADEINMLLDSDEPDAISKSMGITMISFADVLKRHKPDMLVVVGDRYEMISVCCCALNMQIPIAHISGGEITEGAIDDCVRHCLTKMSNLHFPGCEEYRQRIIQLGEQPDTVFNYGDVGVENIMRMEPMSKAELEADLGLRLDNYICMTFHPVTTQLQYVERQMDEVLKAIAHFPEIEFIITKANADAGGRCINEKLEEFVKLHNNCHLFASLGIKRYISLLRGARAVVGNSSSGIIEAPIFNIPTVNIGDRQKGRLMAGSIINCDTNEEDVASSIMFALSAEGVKQAKEAVSPYESGDTSVKIVEEIIRYLDNPGHSVAKKFYDVRFEEIK